MTDELIERYMAVVERTIRDIVRDEMRNIDVAAEIIAETIMNDGIIHVFGAGHSAMAGEELFYRAGGLVPVYPVIDTDINLCHGAFTSTAMENIAGYAKTLINRNRVQRGDTVIVVSTSGVNTFPVETAIEARRIGAKTIAITSKKYSGSLTPRNSYGKHLYEVVDIAIDNHVPAGDATIDVPGLEVRIAPLSTIANSFIVNILVIKIVEKLISKGIKPPVWMSAHLNGSHEWNQRMAEKYRTRIHLLR